MPARAASSLSLPLPTCRWRLHWLLHAQSSRQNALLPGPGVPELAALQEAGACRPRPPDCGPHDRLCDARVVPAHRWPLLWKVSVAWGMLIPFSFSCQEEGNWEGKSPRRGICCVPCPRCCSAGTPPPKHSGWALWAQRDFGNQGVSEWSKEVSVH